MHFFSEDGVDLVELTFKLFSKYFCTKRIIIYRRNKADKVERFEIAFTMSQQLVGIQRRKLPSTSNVTLARYYEKDYDLINNCFQSYK